MSQATPTFDPVKYKETTCKQWQEAAEAWHGWRAAIEEWLGEATRAMLDLAAIGRGDRVLDVAAGAGGQRLAAARRVGEDGSLLATDISSNILALAELEPRRGGAHQRDHTRPRRPATRRRGRHVRCGGALQQMLAGLDEAAQEESGRRASRSFAGSKDRRG